MVRPVLVAWICPALAVLFAAPLVRAQPALGPLRASPANGRYFVDSQAHPVLLAGSHDGWELQDYAWGDAGDPVRFDWDGFLDFQTAYGHNVVRLWCVESTKIDDDDGRLTTPMVYLRASGGGLANDGGRRFDLDRFNPAYFDRLRARVSQAGRRGIYVIVMLFQGWSIEDKSGRVNPWPYHPFHRNNNVNGIDGDVDGDGQGKDLHTWLGKDHPITRYQQAYVRKVIETVGDLDNVLYEIANESHNDSLAWQNHVTDYIHTLETERGRSHPVGITVPFGRPRRPGLNELLLASRADWISPNREGPPGYNFRDNPPLADGRKVVLSDTDHLFGVNCKNDRWVWKTFCRGYNLLYMDAWTRHPDDPARQRVRRALGQVRRWAGRIDLLATLPREDLASTRFCLAAPGKEYLVYCPGGGPVTVDLTATDGNLAVEWFDPGHAALIEGEPVSGGGRRRFRPPLDGDALLHLWRP